ncbi:MAG: hypothetical protein KJZ87_10810 [Thermoguttaceae bacterium]|nr:hypothetical protein [Thermoguttaceae bacterium]
MNLTLDESILFYDLYAALLSFVNRKLKISSEQFSDSREYNSTPPEARAAIRDALFAHRELIEEFVDEYPAKLDADDLEIIAAWKHAVAGKFYIFRYLTRCTVFLSSGGSPNKAYGVLGLVDPLEAIIGPYLPRLIKAVLLPFKGKIIYDGMAFTYSITYGGGVKSRNWFKTVQIVSSRSRRTANSASVCCAGKMRDYEPDGAVQYHSGIQ